MSAPASQRFVCVHGHFYQPPRENPWLEAVEVQDSAAPYHDWNERVNAECYAPNAAARLLDDQGYITALRNNYNHISFNFGPTLLAWLEQQQPHVYAQIQLADREGRRRFGRGNAIAQVYGHCILPLASRRDQQTQVRWGIADFVRRFGRRPDGMWLPETAVDRNALAVLAENGIRFTILAPSQAARVRYADGEWQPVHNNGIDCTRPYRCRIRPGLDITIFFYDADIAHAVAFGGLLNDGREMARRLTVAAADRPGPSLTHVATDGESYGHHHRFGEMALAAAIETIEREGQVQLTNYAAYLDRVAVTDDVEVRDLSSWSCLHGVERWRANCGCNSGAHPGWQQAWRAPLRRSLDWLKLQLDALFERHGKPLLRDPWVARDQYIEVLLRRDSDYREAFLARHALERLQGGDRVRVWKLLEMQRHSLLTFTSCGWFFDDPSGIETTQILAYAARAMQLAAQVGAHLEPEFLRRLQPMSSNVTAYADGRQLYRQLVSPLATDGSRLMAHYAINSLFASPEPTTRVYAYGITSLDRAAERAGSASLAIGRARLRAEVTEESHEYVYAALHLGGHDVHCAVDGATVGAGYPQVKTELLRTFFSEPLSELVRRMDRAFGGAFYTLRDVFVAERRRILDQVTSQVMAECTADYERMVSNNRRLLDFLAQAHVPLPQELRMAATHVLQRRLERATRRFILGEEAGEAPLAVWADAQRWGIAPPTDGAQQMLQEALVQAVARVVRDEIEGGVARAHALLDAAQSLALTLNTWEAQNRYYELITTDRGRRWPAAVLGEVRRLGERLSFHLREWETLAARAA
jgi:alpha-amylase/alpha-mannosidase (GH57 family)